MRARNRSGCGAADLAPPPVNVFASQICIKFRDSKALSFSQHYEHGAHRSDTSSCRAHTCARCSRISRATRSAGERCSRSYAGSDRRLRCWHCDSVECPVSTICSVAFQGRFCSHVHSEVISRVLINPVDARHCIPRVLPRNNILLYWRQSGVDLSGPS